MKNRELIHASIGAVIFKENQVLLIKRGKEPFKGQWSIPGGGLEYGETLEQGLKREVREETNIEIEILALLNVYENLPKENGDPHNLMIDYLARWQSGDPVAGDDAEQALFYPIDEALNKFAWDVTRTAVRDAFEIFQALRG